MKHILDGPSTCVHSSFQWDDVHKIKNLTAHYPVDSSVTNSLNNNTKRRKILRHFYWMYNVQCTMYNTMFITCMHSCYANSNELWVPSNFLRDHLNSMSWMNHKKAEFWSECMLVKGSICSDAESSKGLFLLRL